MPPDEPGPLPRRWVSRRGFLVGATALGGAAVAGVAVELATSGGGSPARPRTPISMAMHVHASASEGPGSMEAQLTQAARIGIDVLWWTEHDQRLCGHGAPSQIHFTGLTEQQPSGHAALWTWTPASAGAPTKATHDFVKRDASNAAVLGDRASALLLGVTGGDQFGNHYLTGLAEAQLSRTSLAGMTISVDVHPLMTSATAFLSINIVSSYRPAHGKLAAGSYQLTYRIGGAPDGTQPGAPTSTTIDVAAPVGQWTTVTIRPEADLARVWPGLDSQDASLFVFSVGATAAAHATAQGYLANLVFDRAGRSGQQPLALERELMAHYAPRFPTVKQIQAIELSLCTPHLGWYGETVAIPDIADRPALQSDDPAYARSLVELIHRAEGVASYCHPYGTDASVAPAMTQDAASAAKSRELVANKALGCDLIEVGYRARGGCDLRHHVQLWDNLSRNAIFVTGVGTNDDHVGRDWLGEKLNFTTTAWAPDAETSSLLAAMRRGDLFFGDPSRFRGRLDVLLDGRPAMGRVSVSTAEHRTLSLRASGIPAGGWVDLVQGAVDRRGPADVTPALLTTRIASTRFGADGRTSIRVRTTEPVFVRFVVCDASGLEVAFTNPVWLLRERPAAGVPSARAL